MLFKRDTRANFEELELTCDKMGQKLGATPVLLISSSVKMARADCLFLDMTPNKASLQVAGTRPYCKPTLVLFSMGRCQLHF